MTDLASWLLAQIKDDEAAARAASASPWRWADPGYTWGKDVKSALMSGAYPNWRPVVLAARADVYPSHQDAAHIARHDPARVLAECAALRRIVQQHGVKRTDSYGGEQFCDECGTGRRDWGPGAAADFYPTDWPCLTLRLLAQPYADRPGFDPAWKVET